VDDLFLQAKQLKSSKRVTLANVPDHGYTPIRYNNRRKPFDDVAFRRALAMAFPRNGSSRSSMKDMQ